MNVNCINMKYRLSPINIFSTFIIIFAIWYSIYPDDEKALNSLLLVFLIPLGFVGFLIDFILQKFIKVYWWLCIIEIILIVATIYINELK